MEIPTYDKFIEPILRFLASNPGGVRARDAYEHAANALNLSSEQRSELLPSGQQQVYKNRAGWAHDRLKRAGLSSSLRKGFWRLMPEGAKFAASNPRPLSEEALEHLATAFKDVTLSKQVESVSVESVPQVSLTALELQTSSTESPDDRLEGAVQEIKTSVTAEILEALSNVSPEYFEAIVLDVLHGMGYGASRNDLQRVGKSGDEGIDGIISLDKLGLEKVYVQAKRWQSNVGRPELQAFYGALAGQHANKGVFITTSEFASTALNFASTVRGIVLVDGRYLAQLMIEYDIGVTSRIVRIPRLDTDYFEE